MEQGLVFNPRFPTPSEEVQKHLMLSMMAAKDLETRFMLCPVCGFKVRKIPVTQTEVVFVKCQKCKFEGVLSPAYFRRIKKRKTGSIYRKRRPVR